MSHQLETIIGYKFKNPELLEIALTHTSYANESEDIVAGAFVYLDEYTEVIFEQYKPRITPATPIPPITISTRILSDNAAINGSV